ncbi:MAG: protease modulator HflC [Planctomycetota bacterium]|jgi:membrane protease subunit HflC
MNDRRDNPKASLLGPILICLAVLLAVGFYTCTYQLDEAEQAAIIQFGAPVGEAVNDSGLHFKIPFIQEVRRFPKQLLAWDGDPNQIPTLGREFVSIDTTARWRISDPIPFIKSLRDENSAQSRLDDIIDSVVRDQISKTNLEEIVRSENWAGEDGAPIEIGREKLTAIILEEAQKKLPPDYGIVLHDVRIKRVNYIEDVRREVFNRMISERERIAAQFRSEGEGSSAEILGESQRELAGITSEAQRQAEVIRGEAEAEAARIYNEAYGADPEFYHFYRSLKMYQQSIGPNTTLFLDKNSPLYEHLQGASVPALPAPSSR